MILVDTSVLGRMASVRSPLHTSALDAIQRLVNDNHELRIAPQSITEFYVVATRPTDVNGFGWSTNRTMDWVYRFEYLFPILPDDPQVHPEWRRLVQHHDVSGKPAQDARLVAFMNVYQIDTILTFDAHGFTRYNLTILDPRNVVPK